MRSVAQESRLPEQARASVLQAVKGSSLPDQARLAVLHAVHGAPSPGDQRQAAAVSMTTGALPSMTGAVTSAAPVAPSPLLASPSPLGGHAGQAMRQTSSNASKTLSAPSQQRSATTGLTTEIEGEDTKPDPGRAEAHRYDPDPDDEVDCLLAAALLRLNIELRLPPPRVDEAEGICRKFRSRRFNPSEQCFAPFASKVLDARQPPDPRDFVRIASGFYRFQEDRYLRLRIEENAVVVYDVTQIPDNDFERYLEHLKRAGRPPRGIKLKGVSLYEFL